MRNIVSGPELSGAMWRREGSLGVGTNSVLDGFVASCGREVLWHGERYKGGVQAGGGSCSCEGCWSLEVEDGKAESHVGVRLERWTSQGAR